MNRYYQASDVLGIEPITVDMVRRGFKLKVLSGLSRYLDLSPEQVLDYLKLSKRTFGRRKQARKFTAQESDCIWRFADVTAKAIHHFGDRPNAAAWLKAPAIAFDGESPLEHASTSFGAREVEQLLARLEHGIPT